MGKSTAKVRYKAEEKRRHAIIVAIILLLVGLLMIFIGTYAYFQTTFTGQLSGNIAVWNFRANNANSSFNITLVPTQTSTTANQTVAPGTSGSFSIVLNTTGSGLAADYTITFNNFVNKPTNLKFYSDQAFTNEINITQANYQMTGTVNANTTETKTIYWNWPIGDASSTTSDNQFINKNVSFTVNVLGRQHQ